MNKKEFFHPNDFTVSVDVFKVDIIFIINQDIKDIKKNIKKYVGKSYTIFDESELDNWEKETNEGRMIPFKGGFIVLLKADKDKFRKFVGILSHECIHIGHYLLRDRRIPLNEDTEEVYTYTIEHIIFEALNKLY